MLVFWAHAELPGPVRGGSGVTIFFFLSGFLITTLMRREIDNHGALSLGGFYVRRAVRILPPMYIAIALGTALTLAGLLVEPLSGGGIAASSFFFVNYWKVLGLGGVPEGLGVLWSLAVEEHFYIFFPIVYILMRRSFSTRGQLIALITVCLGIAAWRGYLYLGEASITRLYYSTDTRIDGLLYGAIMAIACNPVYGEIRERRRWHLTALALTGVAVFTIVSITPMWINATLGYTIQGLALFPIFAYVILRPKSVVGRFLNWRPIAFVGVLSYTVYLIHTPLMFAVKNALDLPLLAEVLLAAMITLGFSYAVYRLVELPMGRLRRRFSAPPPQPARDVPSSPHQLRVRKSRTGAHS